MSPEAGDAGPTLRRPLQVAAIVLVLLGAFVAWRAVELRLYTSMGPGPGFFPLCLTLLLIGLAALVLIGATFGAPEPAPPDFVPGRAGALRVGVVLAGLVAVALLIGPLGMRLAFFLFLVGLPLFLGYRNLPAILAVALIGSAGVFAFFARVLDIPLPVGALGI